MNTSSHTTESERDLVMRLTKGDEQAFCELYATYKERLIYFAMYFLRSREYAEDIFQEAFTTIWQGRKFINPDASFSSYLYTIVRNRVFNQLRDQERETFFLNQLVIDSSECGDEAYRQVFSDDLRRLLSEALDLLSPRQREIFEMSRERCLTYNEIAQALNISPSAVQASISSSLRTLRAYLSKFDISCIDSILLLLCLNA